MASVVAAVIGPLVTAVLAALGYWLRETRQRRNRTRLYQENFELARQRITLIESWLVTHERLASPEQHKQASQRALSDLQQAYLLMNQSTEAMQQNQPLPARKMLARLLLLDSMHTTAARVLGALYYVSLAWLVAWVSVGIFVAGASPALETGESLWVSTAIGLGFFFVSLAMGAAPALALNRLVVAADSRHNRELTQNQHPDPLSGAHTLTGDQSSGAQPAYNQQPARQQPAPGAAYQQPAPSVGYLPLPSVPAPPAPMPATGTLGPDYDQPPSGDKYRQSPGSAAPHYGTEYRQFASPYPQAAWQGATAPSIQTYMLPAILVTLFCFLPTGIAAIVFASQVSSKRKAGDYKGAVRASKRARLWTIASLAVGVAIIAIVMIAGAVGNGGSSG